MDILAKAKEQHPEMFREEEKPKYQPPEGNYGFLIRLVMQWSGGRIRDLRQASMILLGVTIVIFIISIVVWLSSANIIPTRRFSEEEAQKQQEEYKKIQPF